MILVLGGEIRPNQAFPENQGYDAMSDRWATLPPIPAGRHGFGGAVIEPNAYFVVGSVGARRRRALTDSVDHVQPTMSSECACQRVDGRGRR
jgi:hypothetical protein